MFYQTIIVHNILSYGFPETASLGFDRLSFQWPVPGLNQRWRDMIEQGYIDRYCGPWDSMEYQDDCVISKYKWNNQAAAQRWLKFVSTNPSVISTQLIEINPEQDPV
jgi:hypothetical protein